MNRNLGLDIIRSIAIFLVLICHGISIFFMQNFVTHNMINGIMEVTGVFGVELFFVLSGFLIGRIIIKDIIEKPSWSSLKNFYLRRWFRTLPLYYVVLLLLFVVYRHGYFWENLFFLQNYNKDHLKDFSVSWSLSIEEWFYLVVPFIFMISSKIFKGNQKKMFFLVCFTIIGGEFVARIIYTLLANPVFDYQIRKQIHFRMDSIIFGVLLAGIKHYTKGIYEVISTSKFIAISSIVCLLASVFFIYEVAENEQIDQSFYARTLFFTLCPLFVMLIVAFFEANKKFSFKSNGLISKLILLFSITSYSIYLLHPFVFLVINKITKILSFPHTFIVTFASWLVALIACLVLGWLVYQFFEKPIMNIRDRVTFNRKDKKFIDINSSKAS